MAIAGSVITSLMGRVTLTEVVWCQTSKSTYVHTAHGVQKCKKPDILLKRPCNDFQ